MDDKVDRPSKTEPLDEFGLPKRKSILHWTASSNPDICSSKPPSKRKSVLTWAGQDDKPDTSVSNKNPLDEFGLPKRKSILTWSEHSNQDTPASNTKPLDEDGLPKRKSILTWSEHNNQDPSSASDSKTLDEYGNNKRQSVLSWVEDNNLDSSSSSATSSSTSDLLKGGRGPRWFVGLIDDVQQRYPLYKSDLTDALNLQCFAAVLFNAFTQIAGCIAFGGLMSDRTHDYIGIPETLLSAAIGGFIYSLLAGQPLLIMATTGPLLLFDAELFKFCKRNEIKFLPARIWIGIWLSVIAIVFAAFGGSTLIRFCTRFTQEIFAVLIVVPFIANTFYSIANIYRAHPLTSSYGVCSNYTADGTDKCELDLGPMDLHQPNTALLCTILMFGTFWIAWSLRAFRTSKFATKNIRNTVGNFAGPVAIFLMVLLDHFLKETATRKLDLPPGFRPTLQTRDWLVSLVDLDSWVPIMAIVPASLLFVLIFIEVAICELLVSKPENRLVKGTGLHLDVVLVSCINTGMCFLGLPWTSVAIVRCVAHCASLTIWSKGTIVGVKEQRLTNVAISILTAASLLSTPILAIIPLAVIFGIFLYMGVISICGLQFIERLLLYFQLPEVHPRVPYVKKVNTWKMHLFTLIQLGSLCILWGVEYTPAALSFPFLLILLLPLRFWVLPLIFNRQELQALDPYDKEQARPSLSLVQL